MVEKSMAFEWLSSVLKQRYKITIVLLSPNESPLERFLKKEGVDVKRIRFSKKKHYPRVFVSVLVLLLRLRPDVVHAHLFDAQLIGLSAAWMARIKSRIYTRHTSNFHHVYYPAGVKYDRWSNRMATQIVSISQATDLTLMQLENVERQKLRKIYHGFRLSEFKDVSLDRTQALRARWKIPHGRPVIGVIARYIEWKGIQYIIPAFARLLAEYPTAILILANAHGPYRSQLLPQFELLPRSSFIQIPFEEDVVSLYAVFDVYVHVPVDGICEAFGQTYVEALAAGIPSVFTKSGVAAEFIEHQKNAWVVDFRNSEAIYHGMARLLSDMPLCEQFRKQGLESIKDRFDFETMLNKLEQLYEK